VEALVFHVAQHFSVSWAMAWFLLGTFFFESRSVVSLSYIYKFF